MKLQLALLSLAVAIGEAACTPAGTAGPMVRPAHANAARCPKSLMYVVSSGDSTVEIYDRADLKAGPCGTITGFESPQGLFVDRKRNIWVADGKAQQVYVFAPGGDSAVRTLSDPNGVPADIAVDEHSGTAYVADYQNNLDSRTLVEVYAKGSATPTSTLRDGDARNGGYLTLDSEGNLYVTFMTQSNTAQVDEWMNGRGKPKNLGLHLVSDGGIVTTQSGALALCDPFAYRCGIFEQGSRRMTHVFAHVGRGKGGAALPPKPPWLHPNTLAIDPTERITYVSSESVTTWDFPGPKNQPNRKPLTEIHPPGLAGNGIAVSPAAPAGAPF